jgi:rare lipoprotein A
MAGPVLGWQSGLTSRLAASLLVLLVLLAGCTTLPAPPAEPAPPALASSEPSVLKSAEPVAAAAPAASPPRSRLADFIARRLHKKAEKPAPAVDADAVTAPGAPVDEKYVLTGEAARELERGHASWYGAQFHGRRTASGEHYDKYALTAAHKTLPFGTIVRVRSVALGTEVDVRINDRGPFRPGRVIDVSQAAAKALGLMGAGVAEVSLHVSDTLALDEVIVPASAGRKKRKARAARRR